MTNNKGYVYYCLMIVSIPKTMMLSCDIYSSLVTHNSMKGNKTTYI